ncbi:DUF192 domain-containing protein [Chthonobacter albigriseus]|uniref:DUF192 domain-containing protein n=1 Tax=Chthonobacter albigriseus TaxID=1683161 RepID=UPI0015EE421E|nr:DUF192 domain-containing protein [Chthonobacter albigriseus]
MRTPVLTALLLAAALAGAAATFTWTAPGTAQEAAVLRTELVVETAAGPHTFSVELAATPAERAKGLMDRHEMAPGHGMLFDMGSNAPATFWMKNTYLPLDIIFIREDGTVANIAHRTTPLSEALVPSEGNVRFVLELNGGTAERIGLKPGDRVVHPRIAATRG